MAWNNHPDARAFSEFLNSFAPPNHGAGVDYQRGPNLGATGSSPWESWPMAPMGWGFWDGRHGGGGPGPWDTPGRRCRRGRGGFGGDRGPAAAERSQRDDQDNEVNMTEKDDTPDTMQDDHDDAPDPPESVPNPHEHPHPHPHPHPHWPGGRGFGRRRGMHGRFPHGPHHGPGHHHGPPPPPPPPHGGNPPSGNPPHPPPPPPFNFGAQPWFRALAHHPLAQAWRTMMDPEQQTGNHNDDQDGAHFAPPVDVFRTEGGWVLHVAMPGAKKEDLGVHWDVEKSVVLISGVVHRPGDEAFLQGLVSGERKVGLFKREVKLPPTEAAGEQRSDRDEIDDAGITAKLEDGILIVVVPVVEKEWTEVRKVDIE